MKQSAKILVSWVIPTNRYNSSLLKTINSIEVSDISQEIIIVLNGAAIGQHKVNPLSELHLPHIRIVDCPFDGISQALNLGVSIAHGEYIARLDCDDMSVNGRLKKQVRFLEKFPNIGVVAGGYTEIDRNGLELTTRTRALSPAKVKSKLWFENPICHPTVLMRRKAILTVGGYGTASFCEDYDLWLRMTEARILIQVVPTVFVFYQKDSHGEARFNGKAYVDVLASHFAAAARQKSILGLFCFPPRAAYYAVKHLARKVMFRGRN
jgi:glycosyltransferase involved in cell wall biosynthesis